MSNDKLAEALREVLTDINLVKCHWCKCHTWCSVEDACKTLAEHEAHAAEAVLCKHGELLGSDGCEQCSAEAAQAQAQSGVSDAILKKALEISRSVGIETGHLAKSPDEQRMRAVLQAITPLLAAAPQQAAEPVGFEEWMDRDWPLWRNDPNNPNVARLYRMWYDAHPQPAQDARDGVRYRKLIAALPVGTLGDYEVSNKESWDKAVDAQPQPAQDAKECGAKPDDPSADAMLDWLSDMDNAAEIGVYGIDDSGDLRQRIMRAMKAKAKESGR